MESQPQPPFLPPEGLPADNRGAGKQNRHRPMVTAGKSLCLTLCTPGSPLGPRFRMGVPRASADLKNGQCAVVSLETELLNCRADDASEPVMAKRTGELKPIWTAMSS